VIVSFSSDRARGGVEEGSFQEGCSLAVISPDGTESPRGSRERRYRERMAESERASERERIAAQRKGKPRGGGGENERIEGRMGVAAT